MRNSVNLVKNLKDHLKFLESYVQNGKALYIGREEKQTGLRLRELLGNWLVCVVAKEKNPEDDYTIGSLNDPALGDGLICNTKNNKGYATEHVMVLDEKEKNKSSAEELILKAIKKKESKGKSYTSGKILIVFLDGFEEWFPEKVSKNLEEPPLFEGVWIFGLESSQERYIYNVVEMKKNHIQKWKVFISKDFNSWEVKKD